MRDLIYGCRSLASRFLTAINTGMSTTLLLMARYLVTQATTQLHCARLIFMPGAGASMTGHSDDAAHTLRYFDCLPKTV